MLLRGGDPLRLQPACLPPISVTVLEMASVYPRRVWCTVTV